MNASSAYLVSTAEQTVTAEFAQRIRIEVSDIGIPPRPTILDRIDAEMLRDEPDFKQLADAIGADVGIAASLIKISNSPWFGVGKPVRSVPEALLVLGLKVVVQTVAGLALQRIFPHVPSLERFWDSSACIARVSGWLVRQIGARRHVRPEDAYTFGLFRDAGIAVLMVPFPDYPGVLAIANQTLDRSFTAVEDDALAINHAIVGSDLAEGWRLPEEVSLAIRHHHDLSSLEAQTSPTLTEGTRRLIAVSQTAEYLIQSVTGLSQTREWDKLGGACLALLDIAEDDIETLINDSRKIVLETE